MSTEKNISIEPSFSQILTNFHKSEILCDVFDISNNKPELNVATPTTSSHVQMTRAISNHFRYFFLSIFFMFLCSNFCERLVNLKGTVHGYFLPFHQHDATTISLPSDFHHHQLSFCYWYLQTCDGKIFLSMKCVSFFSLFL